MKVIAFNGSPRVAGNTGRALEYVLEELRAEGIETEMVDMGLEVIDPCQVCQTCLQNTDGRCLIETDNVNVWFDKMKAADGILIGSPVYFGGVTAQTKAFIDRIGKLSKANGDAFKRKVGAAVAVHRRAGALNTFNEINLFFLIGQMIVVGSNYWNIGVGYNRGDIEEDNEAEKTMRTLGKNIAWVLKRLAD
ncbi:MAG TPA: flavodoxin family protein [Methanomassiliicoccales archaeon]|nr:flavodoxin family protein [Methanomassiliicoccales archaeon]